VYKNTFLWERARRNQDVTILLLDWILLRCEVKLVV
jgi:hypothetical protein